MSVIPVSKVNSIKILSILIITLLAITIPFVMYLTNLQKPILPTGNEVKIGVVDSGCGYLQSKKIVEYKSFINEKLGFGYKINDPYDLLGHGTLVCKQILENAPNDTLLYSAKVADNNGKITYKALLAAIDWLVRSANVDIINLSLGSVPYINTTFEQIFKDYVDMGVIFVAAAGNRGDITSWSNGRIEWPAALPWVIGVGAVDINATNFADYSSYGMGIHSGEVVDFIANGHIDSNMGTSYSTPYITAMIARLLDYAIKHNLHYSEETIVALLIAATKTNATLNYTSKGGWGLPDASMLTTAVPKLLAEIDGQILLKGGVKNDLLPRFATENYSFFLQAYSPNREIQNDELLLSGNASAFTHLQLIDTGEWGDLFQLTLNIPASASGYYNLSIGTAIGTQFSYRFNVKENFSKHILLDNSQSANAYNFQFGDLSKLEYFLRLADYCTTFTQSELSDVTMHTYDAVMILEPGFGKYSQYDTNFTRFNSSSYSLYSNYLGTGGRVFVLGNTIDTYTINQMNLLVNPWGVNVTSNIPVSTSTFVHNVNFSETPETALINANISKIKFQGSNAEPIGENGLVYPLGWYKHTINEPLGSTYEYLSFGAAGSYKNGTFVVFNNFQAYTNINFLFNELFDDNEVYMLQLLNWLTTVT